MSIASEITRLQGVKSDILTAIADKGVTVPAGSALDDCPDLIRAIISNEGIVEIGGRVYRTVKMPDGKIWLAENLDFKFSGCDIGPAGTPSTPSAWYYDNDEAIYGIDGTRKCGLLYNWYACKLLNDNRSELIPGWHVSTNDEWSALATAVGGISTAGTKLKALDGASGDNWPSGWNGTDDYGFGVLPAGGYNGSFFNGSSRADFWTITESNGFGYRQRFDPGAVMYQTTDYESYGYSVRLVKD